MEQPQTPQNHHSNVDTSRPFRSVKEAVAIFGDRILAGDLHSSSRPLSTAIVLHTKQEKSPPRPKLSPSPSPSSLAMVKVTEYGTSHTNIIAQHVSVESTLKKLEVELEETKVELKMLKERESETEAALAELHRNMSKVTAGSGGVREEERRREMVMTRVEGLPTLAEILTSVNVGGQRDNNVGTRKQRGYGFGDNKDKVMVMKKKPIVPLVGDLLFSWRKKKGSSTTLHNPLYSSPLCFDD